MKRKIWFWLSFVAAILLAVYFATRVILGTMGRGPATTVSKITISADTRDADLNAIAAGAGVMRGMRTRDMDLNVTAARINAIPGVKNAAVRRMPNGALRIKVSMYRAVALWTDGAAYYPLSADGTIVKTPSETRTEGAVVFLGTLPDDISDITSAVQSLVAYIDYLEWIENRRWDLYTTNGIRIMLPEQDAMAAIATLVTLNQNHQILNRNLKQIDMRDVSRILVK